MTTLAELRQANLKEQKQRSPEPAPAETASAAPPPAPATPVVVAPPPALVVVETQPAPSPEEEQEARFFARIHDALAHKTTHPSSAKVSADMPPALFHRAKRYCLDHGNVTLRQVLLELLTAYLEEEGY